MDLQLVYGITLNVHMDHHQGLGDLCSFLQWGGAIPPLQRPQPLPAHPVWASSLPVCLFCPIKSKELKWLLTKHSQEDIAQHTVEKSELAEATIVTKSLLDLLVNKYGLVVNILHNILWRWDERVSAIHLKRDHNGVSAVVG